MLCRRFPSRISRLPTGAALAECGGMTILTRTTITIATLLAFAACKKSNDKPAAGTSPAAKTGETAKAGEPAPKAEPSKAACPAGYTKNEAGGFCFKLATGFTEKPEQKMGSTTMYAYENQDWGVAFKVVAFEEGDFARQIKSHEEKVEEGVTLVEKGDLPNGGKFWIYDNDGNRWSKSTIHGANTIDCSARVSTASTIPNKQEILDQCKTAQPL